jgi:hypothetical protein
MNTTRATGALAELSALLGVEVVAVSRNRPAHERPEIAMVGGRQVRRPAHDVWERIEREFWWLRIVDPSGAEFPITGRYLTLRFESREIRNGRALTERLRRIGSLATLDNHAARRVLRLMHEALERSD